MGMVEGSVVSELLTLAAEEDSTLGSFDGTSQGSFGYTALSEDILSYNFMEIDVPY